MNRTYARLPLHVYVQAVADYGTYAWYVLQFIGWHPNVIYSKAIKSACRDYTEYGVTAKFSWLTPTGREYLRTGR